MGFIAERKQTVIESGQQVKRKNQRHCKCYENKMRSCHHSLEQARVLPTVLGSVLCVSSASTENILATSGHASDDPADVTLGYSAPIPQQGLCSAFWSSQMQVDPPLEHVPHMFNRV